MFGDKDRKEHRFEQLENELLDKVGVIKVFVDTVTGIQYLYVLSSGSAGGLTVMLDENGKPFINEAYKKK